MCRVKQLAIEVKHFHSCRYLVMPSEFVVVAILSEWWLFFLSGGRCRPLWAYPCIWTVSACNTVFYHRYNIPGDYVIYGSTIL